MKKMFIATIWVAGLLMTMFIGCGPRGAEINESSNTNSRIKVKYDDGYDTRYEIIEVDGTEYIAPFNGGITPLIKPDSNHTY